MKTGVFTVRMNVKNLTHDEIMKAKYLLMTLPGMKSIEYLEYLTIQENEDREFLECVNS